MFGTASEDVRATAQRRNSTTTALNDLKKQLAYRSNSSSVDGSVNDCYSEAAIDAFLMRYLQAKRMSVSEALAKLKRRRTFEATLPTISITPAVISILRSGTFSLLGNDNKGRPILFLNLKDFSLPPVEVDEVQRLLLVLFEFMHAKCMVASSSAAASADPTALAEQQSFVLLINEEGAPWSVHLPLLRKAGALYALYAKYYPRLVGLVLIAEAAFEVRQGIQAALAGSDSETSRTIMMVQRGDLSRYMSEDVTPVCLGGALQTNGNALNFAEAVLRHWYTVTSFLQLENNNMAAGASPSPSPVNRPLYVPTPLISNAGQFASLHKKAMVAASAAAAGKNGGTAMSHARQTSPSLFSVNMPPRVDVTSQLSNSRRGGGGLGTMEDGTCSELSMDDITLDDDAGNTNTSGRAAVVPARPLDAEESAKIRKDPEYAMDILGKERAMRIQAEQKLRIAELGVSFDPQNASSVERQVASIHGELNVLVADVILRARAAREKGSEATVSQLLDLTLTALETATAVSETVPAMSMAAPPQQRERDDSTCCSVM